MAEAELTIKYRDGNVSTLFWVSSVCFPLLVFIFFWTSIVLAINIGNHGLQADRALMLMCLNLVIAGLSGVVLFFTSDQIIFLTRNGIAFPFLVCPGPWFRVRKKWSELESTQFISRGHSKNLILHFKGRQKVTLDLNLIPQKQLNELIMALDVWADGADNFNALLEARAQMLGDEKPALGKKSSGTGGGMQYTDLWQDELARRFGATNFIPLEPGEKVLDDTYTIERQLAFGGLSAIYLARKHDQSRIVLKEAVVPQNENAEMVEKSHQMLDREAKMLTALSHEQIVRVYDHFVDKGRHYLVLEYIPGQDLRQLVREEGPQKEEQVLVWALAMAQMLVYLHEQPEPIIHRDFTPDNLVLKSDGSIVVIDFGAANFFLGTATGTMIGKQAYIAPEQLRGKATPVSDIYALGCCLYFLTTGEDPEPLSVSHPREKVPAISAAFDKIAAACTQMEKEDRPQSARAVLALLQELKEGSRVK
ncbi:MAG: serine/threonine protein kinase [Cyanobacteria bacterium SZAS LIN-2]|nr:serine/threonine protein kinase [Cyanobacteria bacterium SZAS LIN-2]